MTAKNLNVSQDFSVLVAEPKEYVNQAVSQKTAYLASLQKDLDNTAKIPSWCKSIAVEQLDIAEFKKSLAEYQSAAKEPEADFVSLKNELDNFIVFKGIKDEDLGQAPVSPSVDLDLLSKAGFPDIPETAEARGQFETQLKSWQGSLDMRIDGVVKIAESDMTLKSGKEGSVLYWVPKDLTQRKRKRLTRYNLLKQDHHVSKSS